MSQPELAPPDRPAVDDPLDRPMREWLAEIVRQNPDACRTDVAELIRLLRINLQRAVTPGPRWPRPKVWCEIRPARQSVPAIVCVLQLLAAALPVWKYKRPDAPAEPAPAE